MATAKVIIAGQNNIGSAVKSAQQDLSGFGQVAQKVGDTLKKAFKVTAIVAAVKKLGDACSDCMNDFLQAQRAYKQLSITLGDSSAYKAVTANIAKLSRQTLSSKNEIESMVSELAALGKTADDINAISDAAVYLSNVTGRDLSSSMTTLLNTYNGNVTQLKKLGVDTSELTKKELEQGAAVQLVIDKFGTLSGEMAKADTSQHIQNLKNNIGDIKQSFGDLLDFTFGPILAKLDEVTSRFKESFDDFIQRTKIVLENIPEVFSRLWEAIKGGLSNLFSVEGFTRFLSNLTSLFLSKIQMIGNATMNLVSLIQGIASTALEGIGNYAMYWITHICDDLGINISETINSVGTWLTESPIGQIVDQVVSKAVNGVRLVGNIIKNIPQIVKITMKNIGTIVSSFFANIPTAIKEIFLGIFDWAQYAIVSIKKNFIQSIEDAIQSIGQKLQNTWVGKVFGLGGKMASIDLGVDITSENELYSKTNAHFANVGAAFTNIGNDLAPMVREIEDLLNPAFEKFSSDNASTIGKAMATWTAKSSDDYYKAAKRNFSSIGDFLKDWGQTFLGGLDEDWQAFSSSFSSIFTDAFGSDFDDFIAWFKPFIEEKLSIKQYQASTGTAVGTSGNDSSDSSGGDFLNSVICAFSSKIGEAGELVGKLSSNMSALGPMFGAILTAIEYIFEGLSETLGPILEDFVKFGIEPLRELGHIVGELLIPIIETLMPLVEKTAEFLVSLFNALGVVLQPIIEIIGMALTPVISMLSSVLEALMPVIKVFAKVVVTITGTIQYVVQVLQHWVATVMNWLAGLSIFGWHPFGGLRMTDPGSPGSYSSYIQSKWSAIDDAFERGASTVDSWKSSSSMNTSTATSISSAGYQGATQVTINIYQQAPVVGDGGMRTFAQMIRAEFEALSYYGVAT